MRNRVERDNGSGVLDKVKWLAEHKEYYEIDITSEGADPCLFDRLEQYCEQIYTYPTEALCCYEQFQEHFDNNPYSRITGIRSEDSGYWISTVHLDGYLLENSDGPKLPAGMLQETERQYGEFLHQKQVLFRNNILDQMWKEIKTTEGEMDKLYNLWEVETIANHKNIRKTNIVLNVIAWFCGIGVLSAQRRMAAYGIAGNGISIFLLGLCGVYSWLIIKDSFNRSRIERFKEMYLAMKKETTGFWNRMITIYEASNVLKKTLRNQGILPLMEISRDIFRECNCYLGDLPEKKRRRLYRLSLGTQIGQLILLLTELVWFVIMFAGM